MSSSEPKNPRLVLLEDHRRIDALLGRLVAAVRADDREAGARLWARTEKALLAHLDVEEMFVFPALRDGHAAEVDRLRRDHDALRRSMGEIGLAFELHTARCEIIEAFCASLREHAEREDSLAYPQAERRLPVSVARSIMDRLKGAVAAAARATRVRKPRARSST